jgi:hypothetical protein
MTFADDERGQPVVIGALLIFTFLILAFSGYQAFIVPQQNAEVEFDHSQQVESEIVDLRVSIVEAALSGNNQATSVKLGTRYPNRLLALNPPPVAGELRTTDPEPMTVNHANGTQVDVCASGEISGEDATRNFVYEADYNEYRTQSTVIYENTFAYSQFTDDATVERLRTNQRLLDADDRTIELIALEGEYSENGVERVGVDFVRGKTREESVASPEITLPTEVENEQFWAEEILGGEGSVTNFVPGESVTFELSGNYDVRCTPVGVGSAPVSGSSGIVRPGGGNNGPPGGQDGIEYENALTTTNGALQFDINNTGGSSAEIVAVRVNSLIDDADEIWAGSSQREIEISGGETTGYVRQNGNARNEALPADGSQIGLDQNAVLTNTGNDRVATVSITEFGTYFFGFRTYDFSSLSRVTQADSWDIRITLELQNQDPVSFYFRED